MKRENNNGEGGQTCPLFLQRKNNMEHTLFVNHEDMTVEIIADNFDEFMDSLYE